jgi:hypothetical protein
MFDRFDEKLMVGFITWGNDDGEELETRFPVKFVVCDRCSGKGKHCNPNIDGNGLTREDFERDPDFKEDYFSGVYDVECEECHGQRVVPEIAIEEAQFTAEQRGAFEFVCERARMNAEDSRTMRMEQGGW